MTHKIVDRHWIKSTDSYSKASFPIHNPISERKIFRHILLVTVGLIAENLPASPRRKTTNKRRIEISFFLFFFNFYANNSKCLSIISQLFPHLKSFLFLSSSCSVVERELNVPLPISKIIKKWNNLLQEYKVSKALRSNYNDNVTNR